MVQILATKPSTAKENMAIDTMLLSSLEKTLDPILHLYEWSCPSITCGYFKKPANYFKLEELAARKIDIAVRPTGGGIVFHGKYDLAFSFLMPSFHKYFSTDLMENYHFVNTIVKNAIEELLADKQIALATVKEPSTAPHFCMAAPTKYDVVIAGKKVAGAAQRRKQAGYLHQGIISLAVPDKELLTAILQRPSDVYHAITERTYAPFQKDWTPHQLDKAHYKLRLLLMKYFRAAL